MQSIVVDNERWMSLSASAGTFTAERFGYTPVAETTVWGARKLPEHLMYFCTHGGFRVVFRNKIITLNRGSFLWVMPRVSNETRLLDDGSPFRTYYLRFHMAVEDGSRVRLQEDSIQRDDIWNLQPLLRDFVQELESPQMYHEQRIRAMLVMLSAAVLTPEMTPARAVLTRQQRERLRRYVEQHATGKVTPQELADQLGLSMPYFRRIFHRSFGMSPKHWIVRQRIMAAAMLLAATELKSKEVAYQLGYCDRYLFSRQFKQVMGVSPRRYRGGQRSTAWNQVADDMSCAPVVRSAIDEALARVRKARAATAERPGDDRP